MQEIHGKIIGNHPEPHTGVPDDAHPPVMVGGMFGVGYRCFMFHTRFPSDDANNLLK
jgi:hypothetical protein